MMNWVYKTLAVVFILGSFAAVWLWTDYQHVLNEPMQLPKDGIVLDVKQGDNFKKITKDIENKGFLKNASYLYWYARLNKQAHLIHAGEYAIAATTTPIQLLDLLVAGKTITYSQTLIEGWNFKQVLAAIAQNPSIRQTLTDVKPGEVMARLGYAGQHPEGRFFPDTYHFPRGTTDVAFLQRAYQRMQQVLQQAWEKRAQNIPLKTAEEALILASVVEKETGVPHERAAISGVFTRRLQMGMKLQTDPTVIYGMGDRFKGDIRYKDLREDTPYNTYVHYGLPPTPICMPGKEAIQAAVNPEEGKALYFVAKGDGSHQFSATLKAHNAAVKKYQLKR
jgi:UPF0755 protein